MKFGVYNEIMRFLINHTFACRFWTWQRHIISHTFLEYYAGTLQTEMKKIIFSVSYFLWSILLHSCHCILHHSLCGDEVPTFELTEGWCRIKSSHRSKVLPGSMVTASTPSPMFLDQRCNVYNQTQWYHSNLLFWQTSTNSRAFCYTYSFHLPTKHKTEVGWISEIFSYHLPNPLSPEHKFSLKSCWNICMMKCRQGAISSSLQF